MAQGLQAQQRVAARLEPAGKRPEVIGSGSDNGMGLQYRAYLLEHAPQISPDGGQFKHSVKITVQRPSAAPDDAVLYYTLDGSRPDSRSKRYDGPISINSDTKLRVISWSTTKGAGLETVAEFTVK